jgi:hypothetical protein
MRRSSGLLLRLSYTTQFHCGRNTAEFGCTQRGLLCIATGVLRIVVCHTTDLDSALYRQMSLIVEFGGHFVILCCVASSVHSIGSFSALRRI